MNNLLIAYIFIFLGVIPYSWLIHEFYNSKRLRQGQSIKIGILFQKIGIVLQISFGVIGLFLQAKCLFN